MFFMLFAILYIAHTIKNIQHVNQMSKLLFLRR